MLRRKLNRPTARITPSQIQQSVSIHRSSPSKNESNDFPSKSCGELFVLHRFVAY